MHVHCADCDQTFLLSPDGATQTVACPHCGGQRLERDQPSPTTSDGDLRNMVDPSTGIDQGGNPNQEGIWGSTDGGWQTWKKRDESFASVRHADWGEGGFDFGDKNPTHKFIIDGNGQTVSLPEPTTHEAVADAHGLHRQGFPQGMSLGELYDNGETGWFQHDTGHSPDALASMLYGHFGHPVVIDPTLKPTTNEERFGIQPGYTKGDAPYKEVERLYGPASPRSYGTPRDNEGLVRGGASRSLNMEPYMPWTHEAEALPEPAPEPELPVETGPQHTAVVTPGAHGIHAGTIKWLQFLGAHINGVGARDDPNHLFATHGMHNSPEFGQPVTVAVHHPDHLPGAIETIEQSAEGSRPTPKLREIALAISQGLVPPPPGIDPSKLHFGSIRVAAFLAPLAEGIGLGGAVSGLMRGALMGTGSHAIQGLLGQGEEQPPLQPPAPRDAEMLSSVTADLETPHGNPGYYHDDAESIDQHEFNDGDQDPNQNNPNLQDSGASGEDNVKAQFSPGTMERVNVLSPLLLHYYHSDQSGASDPLIRALHEQLEGENPGYLDQADEGKLKELLQQVRTPDSVHARIGGPIIGQPAMTGPNPLNAPQNAVPTQAVPGAVPQTVQQGVCPFCGSTQTADGSCPQCGQKANPMGGPAGGFVPGVRPGPMPYTGKMAADHQGPVTDEQKAAVSELLIAENRANEIPAMLNEPWNYAKEMAQVANRVNQPPNIDPNEPPPPQPAQEVAPPGATMPVPNPADPSMMQMAAAVSKYATPHNGAPRCPKCHSATTGFSHNNAGKVMGDCHSCGNVWDISDADVTRTAAEPELNPGALPAADHQERNDDAGDTDSSHTWQDDSGQPLQEGNEYEMHSPGYQIPDKVRVVQVKPNALVVETIGEHSNSGEAPLTYQHEITKEEADLEGLSFIPGDGRSDAGDQNLDEYANSNQSPVFTQPQPAPSTSYPSTASVADLPDDICPQCAGTHISSELSSPTTSYHECFKCGNSWETKEEDYIDENTAGRDWVMNESGPGGDDFFAEMERHKAMRAAGIGSRSLHDVASRDTRLQRIREHLESEKSAKNERLAGKKFTPREQRELIEEGGTARNADKLDLTGTHYEAHRYVDRGHGMPANGENAPDEHMFMGL